MDRAGFWLDWAIGVLGFAIGLYHWYFENDLLLRAGDPNTTDIAVGLIAVALVFEAARRIMGIALPIVCGVFLGYALFGEYLPSPLNHGLGRGDRGGLTAMTAVLLLKPVARASLLPRFLSMMATRTPANMTSRKPPAIQITSNVKAVSAIHRNVFDVGVVSSAVRAMIRPVSRSDMGPSGMGMRM